jgi:hypothetical protein
MYQIIKAMRDVIVNTSVDDIRSSLHFVTGKPGDIEYLKRSLDYEIKESNRTTVIKMLQAKIKKLESLTF